MNFNVLLHLVAGVIAILALWSFFLGEKKSAGEPRSWGELFRVFGGIALAVAVVADIITGNAIGTWILGIAKGFVNSIFGLPPSP